MLEWDLIVEKKVLNMCLAIPGKVIELQNKTAVLDIMGARREVSVELLREVEVGDYVLVHAGSAIQKIDQAEADATLQILSELQEIMRNG